MGIFDQIRLAAQLERVVREKDYSTESDLSGMQNLKSTGSNIITADTIRGCDQNCFECYVLKGGAQAQITHQNPIENKLIGTLKKGEILRLGTSGEPGKNWAHTNKEAKALFERSKENGVTPKNSLFFISKLLHLKGFDPKVERNIEASLDPFYPAHMVKTMQNVIKVKKEHPNTTIALRIRSFESKNPQLQATLDAAIDFANKMGLDVLETRMRFVKNTSLEILQLDKDKYVKKARPGTEKGNQWKLKKPALKGVKTKHKVCDEGETGKCEDCKNCEKLMFPHLHKGSKK